MCTLVLNYIIRRIYVRKSFVKIDKHILALIFSLVLLMQLISAQGPLKAEFYSGKNFEKYISTRSMDKIDLYWETKSPVVGMNPEKCSIRWTGSIEPPVSGEYRFLAKVDYGLRLWIDEELVIDDWVLQDWGRLDGKIHLDADRLYNFKVEYFNAMFGGEIRLMWETPILKDSKKKANVATIIDSKYFNKIQENKTSEKVAEMPNALITQVNVAGKESRKKKVSESKRLEIPKKKTIVPSQDSKIEVKGNSFKSPPPKGISKEKMTNEIVSLYTPKNVHFEHARAYILEESKEDLNRFASFLSLNSYLLVEIEGHTDQAGDPLKNVKLSEQRAYAVARYLVAHGVNAKSLRAIGKGGSEPLIQSQGNHYHPENRRVSFKIKIP